MSSNGNWGRSQSSFDDGVGPVASIGVIALSTDRVGVWDVEQFLASAKGVAVFSTRVAMSTVATPETLRQLGDHLEGAASLLVPGSPLDVIGFSCTSGTVAVGLDRVHASIGKGRPGLPIATPIEAGAKGLSQFGARRISLLVPYLVDTANLIGNYFESNGWTIDKRSTFDLGGDPEMNRVSGDAILEAAIASTDPDSDALFISCTGLRTSSLIDRIEAAIGKPVVTSNQALAWDCLRLAGVKDKIAGQGRLFAEH
ncbi:maleate isomerase [Rhodoligotrophos appendicifer]|uniref:aspartate racemase/maleate isomerase family protein n=1 Tax=Rhodoligotrophos appendicifer TaxID=987056 RepID=UPI00118577CC|nr:hypothetical protein [Rhodoligotrophos appendicifer]